MLRKGLVAGLVALALLGWAAPAHAQFPTIEWEAPTKGDDVSGLLIESSRGSKQDCRVRVESDVPIQQVEFYVDGVLNNTEIDSPYTCIWDTRTTTNGRHQLGAIVIDVAGKRASRTVAVDVANAPPEQPEEKPPPEEQPGEQPPTAEQPSTGGDRTQGTAGTNPAPVAQTPAPAPPVARIISPVSNLWLAYRRYTVVRRLVVEDVLAGATVSVRCGGRGCAFRSRRLHVGGQVRSVRLQRYFGRARLRPGTRVEVRVTRPNTIGKLVRYTIQRNRRLPRRSVACLAPGSGRRVSCT
jgi:hypothetical protein